MLLAVCFGAVAVLCLVTPEGVAGLVEAAAANPVRGLGLFAALLAIVAATERD